MSRRKDIPFWAGLILALFMAAALPSGGAAAQSSGREPSHGERKILYQAQKRFENKDLQACALILEEYLKEHPETGYARFFLLLGNSYFQQEKYLEAEKAYQRGLRLHRGDPLLNLNLALTLERSGRLELAGEQYVRAYELTDPADPRLLHQGAALLLRVKDYHKAREAARRLLKAHPPGQPEWFELLLHASLELKDYDEATAAVRQLLAINPGKADYWRFLAQLQLYRQKYAEAAAALEVAYRYETPSASDLEHLADLYLSLNLPLRAAETLEKNPEIRKIGQGLERLALLYWQGGLYEPADSCLTQKLQRWPDAKTYRLKAAWLYERSEYRKALELLRSACKTYPDHAELYPLRGFAAWQLEDWEEAMLSFRTARRFPATRAAADSALDIIEMLLAGPLQAGQTAVTSAVR
ncbi:MAG: tetratricopeptide repeat protein [Syntrophotaleaceae bacterium]